MAQVGLVQGEVLLVLPLGVLGAGQVAAAAASRAPGAAAATRRVAEPGDGAGRGRSVFPVNKVI